VDLRALLLVHHQLQKATAIAQVNEYQTTVVTAPMYPARYLDTLTNALLPNVVAPFIPVCHGSSLSPTFVPQA
jgi:hypothetical protein